MLKSIMRIKRLQKSVYILLLCCFVACVVLGLFMVSSDEEYHKSSRKEIKTRDQWINSAEDRLGMAGSQLIQKILPNKRENLEGLNKASVIEQEVNHEQALKSNVNTSLNDRVHVFYYMWYGNPEHDKQYLHWNHKRLLHWNEEEAKKWSQQQHTPPDDIGSNFYPELGAYSSQDPNVMTAHMRQISSAEIGVIAVSWYPPDQADDNGNSWDQHITRLMDIAHEFHIKVCFHIEPLKDRSPSTMKKWIDYIVLQYGQHPAFYRLFHHGKLLPLYYIYDSYQISSKSWAELLKPNGAHTIRHTPLDGVFIGLVVESRHKYDIIKGGFDGFYTYFASTGFTFGSTPSNWNLISRDAKKSNQLFIPSVGPGYIDERVRPWNKRNTKHRHGGQYYEHMFDLAIKCNPPIITITSFNEWHEGTQIESAIPKETEGFQYLNYLPNQPNYYLNVTKKWVESFKKS